MILEAMGAKVVGQHSSCGGPVYQFPGSPPCCAWCGKLNPRMSKKEARHD